MAKAAFSEWAKIAAELPNTRFLFRSHKVRAHPEINELQSALAKQFSNISFFATQQRAYANGPDP